MNSKAFSVPGGYQACVMEDDGKIVLMHFKVYTNDFQARYEVWDMWERLNEGEKRPKKKKKKGRKLK